jgi:hypothetical protein
MHGLEDKQLIIADEGAYDTKNPHSLYNILPPSIQEHLLRVKNTFLRDLSEESTAKEIRHMKEYPLVRKVRQSFWREYDNALAAGRSKMHMTRVWQGVTYDSGEFYRLMKKDHFAAYIFTRPIHKEVQERALLELAYEQIEDILVADHRNKDGTLNPYSAKIKLDIWKHLDERVHGGVVKKVSVQSEQKNINVNVETDAQTYVEMKRAEELTKKLAELREQTKDIEAISHVVEEDDE